MTNKCSPASISSIGDEGILRRPLTAVFCSVRCPGDIILKVYDLALHLRDAGIPVISGFHTPMEKECLDVLLRGVQPIVICPARGLADMRIPKVWRTPIDQGRLLLISPFSPTHRRATASLAERRNRFAADLAEQILITHAATGGRTEAFCHGLIAQGKRVLTLESEYNRHLAAAGARWVRHDQVGFPERDMSRTG